MFAHDSKNRLGVLTRPAIELSMLQLLKYLCRDGGPNDEKASDSRNERGRIRENVRFRVKVNHGIHPDAELAHGAPFRQQMVEFFASWNKKRLKSENGTRSKIRVPLIISSDEQIFDPHSSII